MMLLGAMVLLQNSAARADGIIIAEPKGYEVDNTDNTGIVHIWVSLYRLSSDPKMLPAGEDRGKYEQIMSNLADAIYEMTNGGMRLGQVTFLLDGVLRNTADIRWLSNEPRAAATSGGFHTHAGQVYWGDAYSGNADAIQSGAAQDLQKAGYNLGHEFGHYIFTVFDEYAGNSPRNDCLTVDGSSARMPWQNDYNLNENIMNNPKNYFWASDDYKYVWLNFGNIGNSVASTSSFDPMMTCNLFFIPTNAQFRVYARSAWDTITTDPSLDPLLDVAQVRPPRRYYSEVATRAPLVTDVIPNTPVMGRAELNNPSHTARKHLQFKWISAYHHILFLLDVSDSMTHLRPSGLTKMDEAKAAAKVFLNEMEPGNTAFGITTFRTDDAHPDGIYSDVVPLQPITASTDIAALMDDIDDIEAGGLTPLYDACDEGLNRLTAYNPSEDALKTLILLTDGIPILSTHTKEDIINEYSAENIALNTIAYGADSNGESLLEEMSLTTGGQTFLNIIEQLDVQESLGAIYDGVRDLVNLPGMNIIFDQGFDFVPDLSLDGFTINLDYTLNTSSSSANIQILDGTGQPLTPVETVVTTLNPAASYPRTAHAEIKVTVQALANALGSLNPGELLPWSLSLNPTGDVIIDGFSISGEMSGLAPRMVVENVKGDTVVYPEPMTLQVTVSDEYPITGLDIQGSLRAPNGELISITTLNDNGEYGDEVAGDGVFSTLFNDFSQNGAYTFDATVFSTSESRYTYKTLYLNEEGDYLNKAFTRSASTSIVVAGMPEDPLTNDDHGGSPAGATVIAADNSIVLGRIDYSGDEDYFIVNGVQPFTPLYIRIGQLGLGINPDVILFAPDGVTQLSYTNTEIDESGSAYLLVYVNEAAAEDGLIVVVRDRNSNAGGVYAINVGPEKPGDIAEPENIEVRTRETKIVDNQWTGPEIEISNWGSPIIGLIAYYYFTAEYDVFPVLETWYAPNAVVSLEHLVGFDYRIKYDFGDFVFDSNTSQEDTRVLAGVHLDNWFPWVKDNDYSNNLSGDWEHNNKVEVYDVSGQRLYGSRPATPYTPPTAPPCTSPGCSPEMAIDLGPLNTQTTINLNGEKYYRIAQYPNEFSFTAATLSIQPVDGLQMTGGMVVDGVSYDLFNSWYTQAVTAVSVFEEVIVKLSTDSPRQYQLTWWAM